MGKDLQLKIIKQQEKVFLTLRKETKHLRIYLKIVSVKESYCKTSNYMMSFMEGLLTDIIIRC